MGKGAGKGGDDTELRQRSGPAVEAAKAGAGGGGPEQVAHKPKDWPVFSNPINTKLAFTIDGQLYDMTDFSHPGGNIIWDGNNQDATSLFYSTHSMRVWKLIKSAAFMKKYAVERDAATENAARDASGGYTFTDDFYLECKAVVDEHIASRKKKYGQHFDTVIVVLWTLSWYAIASASYWYCMQSGGTTLASVQLGLLWAMAIFNLMHSSMHGAVINMEPFKTINDHTYTIFSGSACPRWLDRHNIKHHGHVNTARDTDKHTNPFLRLHPSQPKRWWYGYQHVYFPVLAAMNTLFNQFTHFKYMQVTPHNTGNMRLSCRVRYYASFATWLVLAYIIPMRCFGFWNALWPCFVFQAAGSLCATYNIIINHVFEMAHTSTESYGQSWAKMSVAGSCNHGAGSMLSTYLSGGLNHQIEHHMFPAVAVHHFPLITKKIQRVCEKHGVPYQNLSYPSLVASCHSTLKLYGNCEATAHLPGLGDYQSLMEGD